MGAMRSKQYREQRHNNIILCATTVLQRAQEARPTVFYSESDVLTRWLLARWLLARWQLARWLLAHVNAEASLPRQLLEDGLIDIAQFHGDESPEYCAPFADDSLPFIKAIGVSNMASLEKITDYRASAILLDTPAPGVYGGTGEVFDWSHAIEFINTHPEIPVLLAGGITPANASQAIEEVHPAALDVASGAEVSPGIKDFEKVAALMKSITHSRTA